MSDKDIKIAEYRRQYEQLKASGQAPKTLPGPSPRPASVIDSSGIIRSETIPGGWYWTTSLRAGEALRIATGATPSTVSLIAWRAADPSERLNYADTVKIQWTSALEKGRVLFSDMGRVMLSIAEDSCGCHDALLGGSTPRSNAKRYKTEGHRNTRDNFVLAAQKLGLGLSDVPPCVAFFAPVRVDDDGRFLWHGERRSGGDYVDLRAEMDLLVALSNCPHPLDPNPVYAPASVDVTRFRASPLLIDDLCRTATDEAHRGFENNAALAL